MNLPVMMDGDKERQPLTTWLASHDNQQLLLAEVPNLISQGLVNVCALLFHISLSSESHVSMSIPSISLNYVSRE